MVMKLNSVKNDYIGVDDFAIEMNEQYCRRLAMERNWMRLGRWIVLASIIALTAFLACGCASIQSAYNTLGGASSIIEQLDAAYDVWKANYEADGGTIGNDAATVEAAEPVPSGTDAVPFSSLVWTYGGFNGSSAILGTPRLSGASCNGSTYSYKWDVGMSAWGASDSDYSKSICAVFIERNGQWVGGKFDWVSVSRTSRGLGHLEFYSGWNESLPLSGRVAFVVVNANGKARSNVVVAEVK